MAQSDHHLQMVTVKVEIQHLALVIIFQEAAVVADITSHQLELVELGVAAKQVTEVVIMLDLTGQQILAAAVVERTGRVMLVPLLTAAQAAPAS